MTDPAQKPASDAMRAEFIELWMGSLKERFVSLDGRDMAAAEHVAWAAFRAARREANLDN